MKEIIAPKYVPMVERILNKIVAKGRDNYLCLEKAETLVSIDEWKKSA